MPEGLAIKGRLLRERSMGARGPVVLETSNFAFDLLLFGFAVMPSMTLATIADPSRLAAKLLWLLVGRAAC